MSPSPHREGRGCGSPIRALALQRLKPSAWVESAWLTAKFCPHMSITLCSSDKMKQDCNDQQAEAHTGVTYWIPAGKILEAYP